MDNKIVYVKTKHEGKYRCSHCDYIKACSDTEDVPSCEKGYNYKLQKKEHANTDNE